MMSELWESEFDHEEYKSCSECGQSIYNGDGYYDIDGTRLCDDCMNNYRRIMDYDDYTYQDYLTEKYEVTRHDV